METNVQFTVEPLPDKHKFALIASDHGVHNNKSVPVSAVNCGAIQFTVVNLKQSLLLMIKF